MTRTAIRLEVLPAAYGDCLLIECPVGKRTWRMLVDTGPDETYEVLRTSPDISRTPGENEDGIALWMPVYRGVEA
jgi:hypothetical protein